MKVQPELEAVQMPVETLTVKYTCYPYLENCQHRGVEDKSKEYYTRKGHVYYYSICNNTGCVWGKPCRWAKVNDKWLVTRKRTPTRNGKCVTVGYIERENKDLIAET